MTWTSKVRPSEAFARTVPHTLADQEWVDALNGERKVQQLDKVTYETFEIVMDRLEKEWFDLVGLCVSVVAPPICEPSSLRADQERSEVGYRSTV